MTPPQAPPLPPPTKTTQASGFALKVLQAPEDYFFNMSHDSKLPRKPFAAPIGPYFVYGTLRNHHMLSEILSLKDIPVLRPARVYGYACKLWGQYPALEDGHPGNVINGSVYHVSSQDAADRLAEYETDNYRAVPCFIEYADQEEPQTDHGFTFLFCGNPKDLTNGTFHLDAWLNLMGRQPPDAK